MLAGRLTGTLNGRPVVIDADERGLTVRFSSFRSAWVASRTAFRCMPLVRGLGRLHVGVRLSINGLISLEVLPKPSGLVRMLLPGLPKPV